MSRGHQRERDLVNLLRDDDWWAMRAPASLGVVDVVALKDGHQPRFYEVKSTAGGPYERFGPEARAKLRGAARMAGARALLCWWPPYGKPTMIPSDAWPSSLKAVQAVAPSNERDALPPVFLRGRQRG